jgi:iron-sulfur cluster insertion protein
MNEGNPKLMLRVFVQGGGCSGLQYGFEFDERFRTATPASRTRA